MAGYHHVALASLLALGACQSPTTVDNAAAPAEPAGNALATIATYNPAQQRLILFRAIRDARQDCSDIAAVKPVGTLAGRPAWSVTCRNRSSYLVTIGADGIADVTDRSRVKGVD